jgi:hypothetical protein
MYLPTWPKTGYEGPEVHPNAPYILVLHQLREIYGAEKDIGHIYNLSTEPGKKAFFVQQKTPWHSAMSDDEE